MAKPPPRLIFLDEFEVTVNGTVYRPHEGESIALRPRDDVELQMLLAPIARHQLAVQAARGDDNEAEVVITELGLMFDEIAQLGADLIVDWDLTDDDGDPLPQPGGDPARVLAAGRGLLAWLFGRLQITETPAERKNGSRPSPTTSSGSSSRRSRTPSGGGRSRPKRS